MLGLRVIGSLAALLLSHWVISGGDFFALRLLTPTLLRLSRLLSLVAERGLKDYSEFLSTFFCDSIIKSYMCLLSVVNFSKASGISFSGCTPSK